MVEKQFDEVPWTIQQTWIGALATLVPWILFSLVLVRIGNTTPKMTKPLAPQADSINAVATFIISSLIEAAFLIAPLYIAHLIYRSGPHSWRNTFQALGFKRFSIGKAISLIVLLIVCVLMADVCYSFIITYFHLNIQTNDQILLEESKNAPFTTYATLLAAVFVAPFCEEIFFRGFVFMGLLRTIPPFWAILFSSLLFAIAHVDAGSFAVLFIIGLALAFLRWRTRSIWPGIILHMLNNGISAIGIILIMNNIVKG